MRCGKYILYFDETGNRKPGAADTVDQMQRDRMNCFGLGGILVKEEELAELLREHTAFCARWNIDYPLHSTRIRGKRGKFGWLGEQRNAELFLPALESFLLSLPFVGIACIIDKPGYLARYQAIYPNRLWLLDKTAFPILIERAARFADEAGRNLEVYFEQTGKKEDARIVQYMRDLKRAGSPFREAGSGSYNPLAAEDYRRIILGEPHRQTKATPPVQIADLVLYPMAKGGYAADYYPYRRLKEAGKLLDCLVPEAEVAVRGIKYSCFDGG